MKPQTKGKEKMLVATAMMFNLRYFSVLDPLPNPAGMSESSKPPSRPRRPRKRWHKRCHRIS